MMRKHPYLILLLVLILIILGLAPWIDGIIFQKKFQEVIRIIDQDERLKLEILDYRRGWFHSTVLMRLSLVNKQSHPLPQLNIPALKILLPTSVILELKVLHGPIVVEERQKRLRVGFAEIHSKLSEERKKSEIMQAETFYGFDRNWSGQFYTENLSFNSPMSGIDRILIEKLSGDFRLVLGENHINKISSHLEFGPVFIEANKAKSFLRHVIIQPIKTNYHAGFERNGLWSGNSSLYTSGISILRSDNINFIVNHLRINSLFSMSPTMFYNLNLSISLGNFTSPNYTMPAFARTQIVFSARNFDIEGLDNYFNSMESKTPTDVKEIDIAKLEALFANIITRKSRLDATISSDSSLGDFSGRSRSTWPDNLPPPNTINEIIDDSKTTINLRMSESFVLKLLIIYADQLLASSDAQLAKIRRRTRALEKQFFNNQQASHDYEFRVEVNRLLKDQKITLPLSLQIIGLERQHQSLEQFSNNMNQLNLQPEIKKQLIELYALHLTNLNKIVVDNRIQQLLRDLSSVGYLSKDRDSNNYTSRLVFEKGILKIFGSPVFGTPANNK